jgi:sortase A
MVEATPAAKSGDKRLWRVVGRVGEVLIAFGVLLLLFVAYQLWGTGLQYSRSQDALRSKFEKAAAATSPAPTTSTTAPATTTSTTNTTSTADSTIAPTTTSLAEPDVIEGDVLALLEIPRLGETTYVIAGVSVADLRKGPGHFPETALPGQLGNAAIAGHRTTYGAPFARINELQTGDKVMVKTLGGQVYVYTISAEPFVVAPTGVDVLADTPGLAELTLISCDPKYTARNRIVVKASLDPAVSPPPAARTKPYTSVPPTGDGGESPTATTSPIATPARTPTVLTGGWFTDSGAWIGVVLWGITLIAAVLAAWWIGRRSRRWIGVAAMVVPFFVFLYFFFENVNRLLPANL